MSQDKSSTAAAAWIAKCLFDIIMPRHCVVCGRKLGIDEKYVCGECAADIPYSYNWDLSHNPMADRYNEMIQSEIEEYEPYAYAASLFLYDADNGYRHICHKLKYQGNLDEGRHFSRMLAERLSASPLYHDVDAVVPVPLHPWRRWKRGYNQAEIIAEEIASMLGASLYPTLLKRRRNTDTQTKLDIEGKKTNVAGAFIVNPSALKRLQPVQGCEATAPQHILIVDDVFTTGATVHACHKALRRHFPHPTRISTATLASVNL